MSSKIFDSVKMTKPGRSTFDLSHDVKMSMKFGWLYPVCCEPVMPGDKWRIGCESLIRMAPMIAPVMHRIDCTIHYFFVPYRIMWDNFFKWFRRENDPLTNLPYQFPTVTIQPDGTNYTTLMDYIGIPNPQVCPTPTLPETISAFPFAAFQKVYNNYYRDQNLITEVIDTLQDGDNTAQTELFEMRKRAWNHDYFTSCLPFAQKGDPVDIPLSGVVELDSSGGQPMIVRDSIGAGASGNIGGEPITANLEVTASGLDVWLDPNGNYVLNQGSATLNDLRIAMRVQEWLEKSARGGTRDNEFIMAQYGVKTSDARLQRPEYITGIKTPVQISEVLNTTGTETAPQGSMAGHGITFVNGNYGSYYAEEPGIIIGIMNVQPVTAYQQGIKREWLKVTDPTELLFPVFGNLGEQAVYVKELSAYHSNGAQDFGYIPRYSEYKYSNNRVAGDFRNTLDFWHMGRIFSSAPALNQPFIEADPTDRIFAVQDGTDYLWCQVYNKMTASRLLPFYGTPTF